MDEGVTMFKLVCIDNHGCLLDQVVTIGGYRDERYNNQSLNESDRFFSKTLIDKCHDGTQYYPVRLLKSFPLNGLAESWPKFIEGWNRENQ